MHESVLKHLKIINWRCFDLLNIDFTKGLNIITGDNGTGKTSLLEAVSLLSSDRSIITSVYSDLIKKGKENFLIDIIFNYDEMDCTLKVFGSATSRTVHFNNIVQKSYKHLISSVSLSPNDIYLIKGNSVYRRSLFDKTISMIDPNYKKHLFRYKKALEQRNILLKLNKDNEIDSWDHICFESGDYISLQREKFTIRFEEIINNLCLTNDSNIKIKVKYLPSVPKLETFFNGLKDQFKKNLKKEVFIGFTTSGPHRDDFVFSIEDGLNKNTLSRGQCVKLAYLTRLAQVKALNLEKIFPVILIDEIGLGLDFKSSFFISEVISNLNQNQVIATTTEDQISKFKIHCPNFINLTTLV